MAMFPEIRKYDTEALEDFFRGARKPEVSEDERQIWLEEAAERIARSGAKGVDFLLAFAPDADETRVRAALLALSLVAKRLSPRKRARVCELAQSFLEDRRAMVVAEAVDALRHFACPSAELIAPLLRHPSPYVVGSALRFFARRDPEKAVPLLESALKAKDPIVRQNAVDELDDMNYTRALPRIRRLLRDPDDGVREAARWAVAHLEDDSQ